tara:strand:- start:3463 stop:6210 length:2748 start_codon:yes stop_codon:yes gene_type:complete
MMDNKELKNFLREQVFTQRNVYLENKDLSENQKFSKIVSILRENDTIDEGLFDTIGNLVGNNSKVKSFLARRVISYLGVKPNSEISRYMVRFVEKRPMKDIQALFVGEREIRLDFAEYSAQAAVLILKRDLGEMFGLKRGTFLGDSVNDGLVKAIESDEFIKSLRDSFYKSLGNLTDADLSSAEAGEDSDNDGVSDGDEQVIGSDPESADEPESLKQKINKTTSGEGEAEKAAEEASEAADKAEEAEAAGDKATAEEAAEDAKEAADKAEDAVEGASDVDAAEAAAEAARKKARKAEASKLRIPMRDYIKAKLNIDNDLGRYDPRISLEDLQVIHDNFVAAETDQQRLAAIETFARAKTFEELTKLIGAPDAEAPAAEPEVDIEEPAEEVPEPEATEEPTVEEPGEETPEPEAEAGEESIPSDVLKKYRRLYDLYNKPGNTFNKALKLSKQIEDLETKYPELIDLDLGSETENEPEVEDLPEPEIGEEPARMTRPAETPGVSKDVEVGEYELSLDPKSEKSKKALLDTIEELQPEGNMELYQANLNKYLDRQVDRFYEEAQEKAPKAKSVKDKKKTEKQYTEEYVAKQTAKMLDVIEDKVSEKGSTEGFSYIFGRAVPTASSPETVEKKISYRQVDVVLDDDKTTVMSSRPPEKTKINRPKLGESILEEERKEIFSVDLPPISVEDIPKLTWTQSKDQDRAALARKVLELLKDKQQENPESVEMFDLGQDEETGTPNLVIMKTSLNLDNTVAAGVIDQRKRGVIEIPEGSMKNTYSTLVTKYITKIEDKKAGIVPGMFNSNKAVVDYPPEVANRLKGKRLKELADHLGLDTSEFEFSMPFIVQYILEKTGDLTTTAPQLRDEPTSKAPEMSPEEEEAMEPSAEDLVAIEKEDEEDVKGLEEAFEISEDLLRRLLA